MKKIFYVIIISLFTITISFIHAENINSDIKLFGKVIYIDPGHGGLDPGTIYKNIYEKDINLQISKKLKKILEDEGAIVYLTRYSDYDLATSKNNRKTNDLNNRAKIINDSKADLYLSIHLNSTTSSTWNGAQVFYDDINSNNKKLANIIQNNLNKKRDIKEITNILLNRKIKIPGVLIELGFLSNPSDRYLLQKSDYQYELSIKIKDSIIEYFK